MKITPEKIIEELAAIAFARAPDYFTVEDGQVRLREDLKPRQRAAVASMENGGKVKFYDKMKALELLGKHFGLFDGRDAGTEKENNPSSVKHRSGKGNSERNAGLIISLKARY